MIKPSAKKQSDYATEPITLTTGDLNNIKTYGKYYWSGVSSQNISNTPATGQSIMEVINVGNNRVIQIVYLTAGSHFYIRRFDTSSWGTWYHYASTT